MAIATPSSPSSPVILPYMSGGHDSGKHPASMLGNVHYPRGADSTSLVFIRLVPSPFGVSLCLDWRARAMAREATDANVGKWSAPHRHLADT